MEFLTLGELIKYHRDRLGLSQRELSKRAGVTRSWLSVAEAGQRSRPDPDMLRRVARVLDVHPDALLERAGYRVESVPPNRERPIVSILREALAIAERLEGEGIRTDRETYKRFLQEVDDDPGREVYGRRRIPSGVAHIAPA